MNILNENQGLYIDSAALYDQKCIAELVRQAQPTSPLAYHIEAYGCQMNVRDAESLSGMLEEMGFVRAATMQSADLILFHTCCVRDHAEKRVFGNIGALRDWHEEKPHRILAVSGCMMQQEEVANRLFRRFPFVDIVFGTHVMYRLPSMIRAIQNGERLICLDDEDFRMVEGLPARRQNMHSAFVNIMFGCDNFCSYCIVPYVRGRERSRAPEDICAEIRGLTQSGISEVTLLGQNVNSYGKGCGEFDFSSLLSMVSGIDGISRIRFMTSHPKDLSERLAAAMSSSEKICRHIHLPVQSGSDAVLRQMNRKYSRMEYLDKVAMLRRYMPDIAITTDIIVGFPGETDDDFADTLSLVNKAAFSSAFTFKYSPRKGTRAAEMPDQIPEQIKKERLAALNSLQQSLTEEENRRQAGKTGVILIEGFEDKKCPTVYGKLPSLKMVYVPGNRELIGTYQSVTVTGHQRNSLIGRLCDGNEK